jgi:hypothetical protein
MFVAYPLIPIFLKCRIGVVTPISWDGIQVETFRFLPLSV